MIRLNELYEPPDTPRTSFCDVSCLPPNITLIIPFRTMSLRRLLLHRITPIFPIGHRGTDATSNGLSMTFLVSSSTSSLFFLGLHPSSPFGP